MQRTELLAIDPERWVLWLPVGLAVGIALYFALPCEPPPWLGGALLLGLAPPLWLGRRRGWAPVLLAAAIVALGFTAAQGRSQRVAAPVLTAPTELFRLQGRVVEIDPEAHGQRLLLDRLVGGPLRAARLQRVRVTVRSATGLQPGQVVQMWARLTPPPAPWAPAGYDLARAAWFEQLGAVGYAIGRPVVVMPATADWRLVLTRLRQALGQRISASIESAGYSAGIAAVATALITGQRGPVPAPLLQAYRDAGLAHILVIAGMHLSMVAGLILVLLRATLAAIPWLALRQPIHKWTAAGALLVSFAYLLISGAPVPTQRAFIMIAVALLAVLLDRQAVSLRGISLAASLILLAEPEALTGASFQLSFAAVYGLICGYEALAPRLAAWRQADRAWWTAPLLYAGGILLTTQIAGSATAFYSLYHFNRYAVYSLLGNLLAVPLVGFWVMPAALLGCCLLPLGLDGWGWQLMAAGLTQVSRVALMVSHLPGATLTVPVMPAASLLLFSAGFAWLLLWRRRWRLWGLPAMAGALLLALLQRPPDLLVDADLRLVAARQADGRLHIAPGRRDRSLRQAWAHLAGEGDALPPVEGEAAMACDDQGCRFSAAGRAQFVPIDRSEWRRQGTHAVWLTDGASARLLSVADWQGDRPWRHLVP
jgi:competence protein ComEC